MTDPIVITGFGAVSPYGVGARALRDGLKAGISAIGPITRFDAGPYRSGQAAQVPAHLFADPALAKAHGDPGERATLMAAIAAQEALAHAGLIHAGLARDSAAIGCVVGTLCSGGEDFAGLARAFTSNGSCRDNSVSPPRALVGYQLDFLSRHFGLRGPAMLVSTACSSSTDALGLAADLLADGACDIVLAGGGDILAEPVHAGFASLHALSAGVMRPFDKRRDGFAIGEGAGLLVLETRAHAAKRGAAIYGTLLGYGLSNTATSLTAPSTDGAAEALAIRRALDDAGLAPGDIDYVNTHGTATPLNDAAEAKAMATVFGAHAPAMIAGAIKPMIGHCMGAAGALEALSTLFSLREGWVPGAATTLADEDGLTVPLATALVERPLRRAISQSFGFGGACSCVVLGHA